MSLLMLKDVGREVSPHSVHTTVASKNPTDHLLGGEFPDGPLPDTPKAMVWSICHPFDMPGNRDLVSFGWNEKTATHNVTSDHVTETIC